MKIDRKHKGLALHGIMHSETPPASLLDISLTDEISERIALIEWLAGIYGVQEKTADATKTGGSGLCCC